MASRWHVTRSPVRNPTTTLPHEMTSTDTRLLDILEAHGQKFLESFKSHKPGESKRKRVSADTAEAHRPSKLVKFETDRSSSDDYSDSEEEWTGFGSDGQVEDEHEIHSSTEEEVPLEGVLAGLEAHIVCKKLILSAHRVHDYS
jgi:hypothetical protein